MSEKLISADDILKYTVLAGEIRNPYMEVVSAYFLREAPAVDAVEVVRCKDCEYYLSVMYGSHCELSGIEMDKNGYCSYGERREENAVD